MMASAFRNLCFIIAFILPSLALADDERHYNQISLNSAASTHIANDLLIAMLVVEEMGSDTARLANQVNEKMAKILAKAEPFKAIDSHTVSYATRPIYKKGVIHSWHVSQTIKLSSQNFEQLSKLIAKVNPLANVQSMQFTISDSKLEQVQEELTLQAIDKFRTKAAMVTERFGKSSYVIINVNIGSNSMPPRPMMNRSFMKAEIADAAPPALSGGTNKVTVNINGNIELL